MPPPIAMPTLDVALARLYVVFARYPLRPRIDGCPHCVRPDEERQLHVRPLADLTVADLGRFPAKSMTTWGDALDFKHFLPRMCALAVAHDLFWGFWHFAGKLRAAGGDTWPADERAAIADFLLAWWSTRAATLPSPYPHPNEQCPTLADVAAFVPDLRPALAWLASQGTAWPGAALLVVQFAECWNLITGQASGPWSAAHRDQIEQWALEPATLAAVAHAVARAEAAALPVSYAWLAQEIAALIA